MILSLTRRPTPPASGCLPRKHTFKESATNVAQRPRGWECGTAAPLVECAGNSKLCPIDVFKSWCCGADTLSHKNWRSVAGWNSVLHGRPLLSKNNVHNCCGQHPHQLNNGINICWMLMLRLLDPAMCHKSPNSIKISNSPTKFFASRETPPLTVGIGMKPSHGRGLP